MMNFKTAARCGIPALVFALPLFFVFSLNDTFDLPKLALVIAVVAGLLLCMKTVTWTGMEGFLLAFLVIAALSTLQSIDRDISFWGLYRVYVFGLMPMIVFALLFVLSAQCDCNKSVSLALMAGGALAGYYALLQYGGYEFLDAMPRVVGGRPWSSLGNPVYLGAVCMIALLVSVGEWKLARFDRWLIVPLLIGQLAGLFLSLSRSAWLGTLAGILFLGVVQKQKKLLMTACAVVVVVLAFMPAARQRAGLMFAKGEHSNAARVEGWKGALRVWKQYPLLGSGPDTFFEAFRPYRSLAYIQAAGAEVTQAHAHNEELQIAATLGTWGILAYAALLIGFGWRIWRACRERPNSFVVSMAAASLALFVQDQFNFSSITTTAWGVILLGQILHSPNGSKQIELKRYRPVAWACSLFLIFVLFKIGSADAAYKEGQNDLAMNQPVLALVQFRQSVRLRADVQAYQTALGNTARTLAQLSAPGNLRTELFKEAWQAALTNTRRHAQDPDAWNNQGVVAMWRNQLNGEASMAEARAAFEQATRLDPYFVDGWANLAKWRHLNGDLEGEKIMWRKVLTIDPQQPMAHMVLGQ